MIRALVPHAVTALRVALGGAAVVAALDGRVYAAASLVTLSALGDGVDGHLARRVGVSSPFGALFDYYADYLTFVVAPWTLGRALLGSPNLVQEIGLGVPLLTGAVRYARNGAIITGSGAAAPDLPGVGTVFAAFVSVTAVFLDAPRRLGPDVLGSLLPTAVAVLALLMLAPLPYPKLTRFRGWSPVVLVLLAIMPFAGTAPLAAVAVILGVIYVVAGPFLAGRPRRQ